MTKNVLVAQPSLIQQADSLAKEHEQFNETYIVAGRLALYGLLQKIMKLYEDFERSQDMPALIKYLRTELAETYGIKTQENTSDAAVLVRYITRADRKTAHVYARAIEIARSSGINSETLIEYLKEKGGVEKIRASGVDPVVLASKKQEEYEARQNMWEFLRLRAELPFATFRVAKGKLPADRGEHCLQYLVAARRGDEYRVITALDVDDELELKLLEPFQQAVTGRMAADKDALEKMRQSVNRKKMLLENNLDIAERDEKCTVQI